MQEISGTSTGVLKDVQTKHGRKNRTYFFLNHQDAKYSTVAGHILPSSSGSRHSSLSFSIFSLSFSNLSIFALEIPVHKTNIGKASLPLSL